MVVEAIVELLSVAAAATRSFTRKMITAIMTRNNVDLNIMIYDM